ncbi:hypothetical protein M408DRAFT_67200 [Serendipita vermifera MAFF 305830]|uniref:Uncharacterized protein n=1 Tax=Serendipita vermifera MAFF 305830 TaxID=933852 RepID=A0A0C2WUH6_SERVB|nr:hypothetical protein M408DRAFT_67200 [Serendipita vermifera MAFF 305830]
MYTKYGPAEHPSLSTESNTPTAISSLVSLAETPTNAEKGHPTDSFAHYEIPILPVGVKSALSSPVGQITKFRVWYNPYRQLFTLILIANSVCVLLASLGHFPHADMNASAFALGNILTAVSVRNELFLRGLFCLCVTLFQKWTPLWFRIALTAFLQHLGGIHSGAATSSLIWLIYALIRSLQSPNTTHVVVLAMSVTVTFFIAIVILSALPFIRERHHNVFEHHHRFAGWGGLVFTWVFVVLGCMQVPSTRADGGNVEWKWDASALVRAQQFWFALFITILIFVPWFTVRKVQVEITTPSPRVALIKFQCGIQQGLFGRISRDPLREYHGFGIISEGIESGCHYMVVGVQGDWTRGIVSDPPTHLYTREMKFSGLPYLSSLYKKGIMICTGSGIGAVLSTCIQLDTWFLIWIGAGLEETFGRELMGIVERQLIHDEAGRCILFDTKKEGRRPDTVQMLKDVYAGFEAEDRLYDSSSSLVIIITSNPAGNAELMQACRENGMHSFGPLWDS